MTPAHASAKKSSPLLCQSEVSSSGRGLAHLTLENQRLSSAKKNRNQREICKERSFPFPHREIRLVVWRQQAKNSTTKDISLGVNVVGKSHKAGPHANLVG